MRYICYIINGKRYKVVILTLAVYLLAPCVLFDFYFAMHLIIFHAEWTLSSYVL